jgi:hypothetical protein
MDTKQKETSFLTAPPLRVSCGLVARATVEDWQRLMQLLELHFPQILVVRQKMSTDRLWLVDNDKIIQWGIKP